MPLIALVEDMFVIGDIFIGNSPTISMSIPIDSDIDIELPVPTLIPVSLPNPASIRVIRLEDKLPEVSHCWPGVGVAGHGNFCLFGGKTKPVTEV